MDSARSRWRGAKGFAGKVAPPWLGESHGGASPSLCDGRQPASLLPMSDAVAGWVARREQRFPQLNPLVGAYDSRAILSPSRSPPLQ